MELRRLKCPVCGNTVEDSQKVCTFCGLDFSQEKEEKSKGTVLMTVICIVLILMCAAAGSVAGFIYLKAAYM